MFRRDPLHCLQSSTHAPRRHFGLFCPREIAPHGSVDSSFQDTPLLLVSITGLFFLLFPYIYHLYFPNMCISLHFMTAEINQHSTSCFFLVCFLSPHHSLERVARLYGNDLRHEGKMVTSTGVITSTHIKIFLLKYFSNVLIQSTGISVISN